MRTYSALFDVPGATFILIVFGSITWVVWTVREYRHALEEYDRLETEWRRFRNRKRVEQHNVGPTLIARRRKQKQTA